MLLFSRNVAASLGCCVTGAHLFLWFLCNFQGKSTIEWQEQKRRCSDRIGNLLLFLLSEMELTPTPLNNMVVQHCLWPIMVGSVLKAGVYGRSHASLAFLVRSR